ncbi:CPBP family intramembrane glutamic endopeptidase [Engelhardtia mirabilis]|uniref:CAAX amino terminal protease self-immunity n=1 Tax=Engelhardtia mirabilis TaxID=2528011 RepID=A0A518BMS6_9BACT|nr:CAAX amino terminal protease self- immunity [Planctomycetes bacterium Pla133]QDV02569.1 CAAX amino terminal protease self- immunity [Planctomycetes bacterium Pla86]
MLPTSPSTVATALALTGAGVALAPVAAQVALRLRPGRNVFFARWGFSQVSVAVIAGLLLYLLGGLLPEGELTSLLRPDLLLVGGAIVAVVAAERTQPEGWRSLGFHRGQTGRSIAAGVATYLCCLPLLVGLTIGWPLLLGAFGGEPREVGSAVRMAQLDGTAWTMGALALVLVAPVVREVVLRGFLQPLLVQNFSERGGIALGGLLFALLQPVELFAPALGMGVVLGVIMLRTQSLAATITAHALHQALWLGLAAGAAWTGINPLL